MKTKFYLKLIAITIFLCLSQTSSKPTTEKKELESNTLFTKLFDKFLSSFKQKAQKDFLDNSPLFKEKDYNQIVKVISQKIKTDPEVKSAAYNRVAYLVDTFGPRLWGSEALLEASKYMQKQLIHENFEAVSLEENPNSLHWVRGSESLIMLSPRKNPTKIPMVGLGKSIGGNVTGELIIFESFEELEKNASQVSGKIVLFNPKWTAYGDVSKYRANGASQAAKHGAIGCLVRSLTPYSIESPHGGAMNYNENYTKIPAAAISLEDADMFSRMVNRGQIVVLNLQMEAHFEELTSTYNVVGQITGSKFPNEIVLIGGHIDSWDVGPQTGANDDAAGFMVCMEAIRVLIKLNLRPRRTIRFIAWSGEEFGDKNSGGPNYARVHMDELDNHVIAFESDLGTTDIEGFGFSGGSRGYELFKKINEDYLMKNLNLTRVENGKGVMQDTTPLYKNGIPVVRNLVKDTPDSKFYFTYHHSAGDTVSILDKDDMDKNVAAIASLFYIIADMPDRFPRN
jgi:carboxypeptidase Q